MNKGAYIEENPDGGLGRRNLTNEVREVTMRESELPYLKEWRLRKMRTNIRKAQSYARKNPTKGLNRLMLEHHERDLVQIERELEQRKNKS